MMSNDFVENLAQQDRNIAVREVAALVNSPAFSEWLANPQGAFPLAILTDADVAAIGARTRVAQLSGETVANMHRNALIVVSGFKTEHSA